MKHLSIKPKAIVLKTGVFLFLFISSTCFSQSLTDQKVLFGLCTGINHTKFQNDTLNFNYGTRFVIGGFINNRVFKKVYLKNSLLYSVKGSNSVLPYFKVVNTYIDYNLIPQIKLGDGLFIQAGLSYSYALNSKKVGINGGTTTGLEKTSLPVPASEVNGVVGLEFRVYKHVNFAANYFFPLSKTQTQNFQFTLNFTLNNKTYKKVDESLGRKEIAQRQIHELKEGTLLVRLKTSELTINKLHEMGFHDKAEKIKRSQEEENKIIINAFKTNFNFCKTAFFYSNNTKNVRNGLFENIFLDDSLLIDPSVKIDTSKAFFIAEFGTLEQDTVKYKTNSSYIQDNNFSGSKVSTYSGGPDFGYDALLIRDKNFVQLSSPFPYHSRIIFKSQRKSISKTYNQAVWRLNKKLNDFYGYN